VVVTFDVLTSSVSRKPSTLGSCLRDSFCPPDYNIAPSTFQPVIRLNRDTGER